MNTNYDPLANVQAAGLPGSISFVYGLPDPETFPLRAGDPFFAEQPNTQHLRLSFSYVPPDKIREGIKKLSGILICL